jgi:hypothetical protein
MWEYPWMSQAPIRQFVGQNIFQHKASMEGIITYGTTQRTTIKISLLLQIKIRLTSDKYSHKKIKRQDNLLLIVLLNK